MRNSNVAGLGRVVLSLRERPILLEPMGNGMRGVILRFNHKVRDAADYFDDISPMALPKEMLQLAEHIMATKAADFDPVILEDHYRNAMVHMLREKQAKKQRPRYVAGRVVPSRENVINIMDALKRSLAAEGNPRKPPPRRAVTSSSKSAPRKTSTRSREAG